MDFILHALDLVALGTEDWPGSVPAAEQQQQQQRVVSWNRWERHDSCARFERVYYADWVPAINEQLPRYPGGTSTERHFAPASVLRRTREVRVVWLGGEVVYTVFVS